MNFSKNFSKSSNLGFTLIELLVVVAIIGILASIVLSSLDSARAKGEDAAVKENMDNIRAEAEIYYGNNTNSYGTGITDCLHGMFTDPVITLAMAQVVTQSGGTMACNTDSTGQFWSMSVSTLKGAGTSWCVDNNAHSLPSQLSQTTGICA